MADTPERRVMCAKFKTEMPGLSEPPFDNELGKRVYETVSKEAWGQWVEHMKMLMNEYRLNLGNKEAQEFIMQQMEEYFWGEGKVSPPPDFVPPSH